MKDSAHTQTAYTADTTVGEIVADDIRTATIFERYGIDFCCGGKIALATICAEKGLDSATILREIAETKSTPVDHSKNFTSWDLPFLADYIVNTHHAYLNENSTRIAAYADKIAVVHGAHHPEVIEIAAIFRQICSDMTAHLKQEEDVLFPTIRRIAAASKTGAAAASDRDTIRESLVALDQEHQAIGDAVHTIRHISRDYALPTGVCTTYELTYRMLKEFEDDLHMHVHLENNILFPGASRL